MKRPTGITRPDTAQLTTSYNDATFSITEITPVDSSGNKIQTVTQYDALGRSATVSTEDKAGTIYTTVLSNYDPGGRPFQTSNPYLGSSTYCTTSSWYCTQTNFDALGRPEKTILQDNSSTTTVYSGNCSTTTDPSSKSREACFDASGRMTMVLEDPSGLNYSTNYVYNVLDKLTNVSQGGGSQTRAYLYDGIGRLTSSTTPEAGLVQFQYNSFDLVNQRTDARGVITTYGYDNLNRLSSVSYNVGASGVPATPGLTYTYDTGGAPAFALGRLTKMTDGAGTPGSETYTYDLLGRVTSLTKVINGTSYPISYAYNYGSEATSITYPSGRVIDQSYDGLGRLCAISGTPNNCTPSSYYADGYTYNSAEQLTAFSLGNGVGAAFTYPGARLQLALLTRIYQKLILAVWPQLLVSARLHELLNWNHE